MTGTKESATIGRGSCTARAPTGATGVCVSGSGVMGARTIGLGALTTTSGRAVCAADGINPTTVIPPAKPAVTNLVLPMCAP